MTLFDFDSYCRDTRLWFDAELRRRFVPAQTAHPEGLHRAIHYSLFAPGKRMRPLLVFASAAALGIPREDVLPIAACLEMIHVFSLIHDDLPCMDDDDLRRGQATNHKVYGEAVALLAGDALLAQAFLPLADLNAQKYTAAAVLAVLRQVVTATGSEGMIGGQALDLAAEGRAIAVGDLQSLHARKTGALISAAVLSPALLIGSSSAIREALSKYASSVGLAFQIVDDILDVEGENIGKNTGSDVANAKSTYPALLGLGQAKTERDQLLQAALDALSGFDACADALRALAKFTVQRKS